MKTTKRVLAVLLALTMLVGLLAVASFAAEAPYDGGYGANLWLSADKDNYAAGDTVVLTVSEQFIDAFDQKIDGQYPICYPAGKIEPLTKDDGDLSSQNFTALVTGYDAANSAFIGNQTLLDAFGYTDDPGYEIAQYNVAGTTGVSLTGHDKTALFTFELKIDSSCPDGEYEIYFYEWAFDNWLAYAGDIYKDGSGATDGDFKLNSVTIKVGAPSVAEPKYLKTQCQWANGDTSSNLNVGISATFSTANFPIAFDANGHSTNVTAVGVDVTAGDYTETQETQFVYKVDDTTYRYRAVITGVPHNATGELTVQFFIVINGEKKLGEIKTINLGDVITASTDAGLPAYTGA
jgi:hypothetical protein